MAAGFGHETGSPLPRINQAWRRITVVVITGAVAYKVWRNYTRLGGEQTKTYPGAFTGNTGIEPAERKSKYEGAGNSALGRRRGDKFT